MRRWTAAFVLAASLAAADHASAGEMTGNTQFLIGQRYLGEIWEPLDEPSNYGIEIDFAPKSSPVHVALAIFVANDSGTVTTPFFGETGNVDNGFLEFSAGFLWHPVKRAVARPYVGAGVLKIYAATESMWGIFSNNDSDDSFGFYGNAGIFFKVGERFNIGLDGRVVRGTKITLAGLDVDADYEQASLLVGFSWGGDAPSPDDE